MKEEDKSRPGHKAPAGYDPARYQKPSVACDVVIVSYRENELSVLLIERKKDPYQGYWALPGGFVEIHESLEAAAAREVEEETGVSGLSLISLGSFGDPERDPRTRVISAAYLALVRADRTDPRAGDDAKETGWFSLRNPPEMAFDHRRILEAAQEKLLEVSVLTRRLFELLPESFTKKEFLCLAGQVTGKSYDRDAFFRSMDEIPAFVKADEELYRFHKEKFRQGDLFFLLLGDREREKQ
ncbi:MAG: NUDIX hydrolase [bacterium]